MEIDYKKEYEELCAEINRHIFPVARGRMFEFRSYYSTSDDAGNVFAAAKISESPALKKAYLQSHEDIWVDSF